jgi:hypothetical protein
MKKLLLAFAVTLTLVVTSVPLHAEDDLGTLVRKGLAAMKANEWEQAYAFNSEAT